MMKWKVGDWAIFDRNIVQIKKTGEYYEVSDGSFTTSGNLSDRLRPLTLRNKATAEWFDWHYDELRKMRGSGGFNYPDISRYFTDMMLQAIDGPEKDRAPFDEAQEFLKQARDYVPVISGIQLFREAA